jgi:hypothetical protein
LTSSWGDGIPYAVKDLPGVVIDGVIYSSALADSGTAAAAPTPANAVERNLRREGAILFVMNLSLYVCLPRQRLSRDLSRRAVKMQTLSALFCVFKPCFCYTAPQKLLAKRHKHNLDFRDIT